MTVIHAFEPTAMPTPIAFIVLEGGRIRIDLKSADRDSYLYLIG